jgi:hypothetical protein
MKKIILILTIITLTSCVNEKERLDNLQKMYPFSKVEPATNLIKNSGYEYIAIDTNNQIIAVSFHPFSTTKISSFRNIR